MRSFLLCLTLALPAAAADQVSILPEVRIDLKPTPRDATEPIPQYSYPASYQPLHDPKFPKAEPIPEMEARKPKEFVGDRRFFAPMAWNAVAASPDGKLLACGGSRVVTLFDAKTGKEEARLYGDFDAVNWLRFSPDGKRLYSTTQYGNVRVWDAAKKLELAAFAADSFTLTPDAKFCAGIEWEEIERNGKFDDLKYRRRPIVRVRNTASWKCESAVSLGDFVPKSVAISPDGKLLALGGKDGSVRVIDPKDEKELAVLEKVAETVDLLAFSPNGKTVAAAFRNPHRGSDAPHTVTLWDCATHLKGRVLEPMIEKNASREEALYGKLGGVTGLQFHPDGKQILTCDGGYNVRLWDVATGKVVAKVHKLGLGHLGGFSPDGSRVYLGGGQRLCVLTAPGLKEEVTLPASDDAPKLGFELHGELPKYDDRRRRERELPGGEVIRVGTSDDLPRCGVKLLVKSKIAHTFEPDRIVGWDVSPDGKTLACFGHNIDGQGFDFPLRFYDIPTRTETAALRVYPKPGYGLRFSPDGKRLAVPHHDGLVRVWDVATLKPLLALDPDGFYVDKVTFSKDGKKLVGGNAESKVLVVWDTMDERK